MPETTEEPHFDLSSWRVPRKIFATIPPGGDILRVNVDPDECHALVEGDPEAFAEIIWGKRPVRDWVQVNLPAADQGEVRELLEDAWRRKAPKRGSRPTTPSRRSDESGAPPCRIPTRTNARVCSGANCRHHCAPWPGC